MTEHERPDAPGDEGDLPEGQELPADAVERPPAPEPGPPAKVPADEMAGQPQAEDAEPGPDEGEPDRPDRPPTQAAGPEERPDEAGAEAPEAERPERPPRRPRRRRDEAAAEAEVIPGEHLEPDLVLEEERRRAAEEEEFARYAEPEEVEEAEAEAVPEAVEEAAAEEVEERPAPATPLDLAADARYPATGKRKTSVARVILRPGSGTYSINGRPLDQYFPRPTLQAAVRQPLVHSGYASRMDVVAKIHGGGVAAQAGALRHGVARALVEADPNLRGELKRRGFLTRDARAKERKKAGLKKARKRPQFSKR